MDTPTPYLAHPEDRPVDPWTILAGDSVGIVAGFGVDLLRLGAHRARRAWAARTRRARVAACGWQRPGSCDAGAR